MRKAIVLSRVSTLQQDLKQQTEEVLREVYKDGFKEEEVVLNDDYILVCVTILVYLPQYLLGLLG